MNNSKLKKALEKLPDLYSTDGRRGSDVGYLGVQQRGRHGLWSMRPGARVPRAGLRCG